MITVEIMMIICFVLYGFALYIMYRYFNDVIDEVYNKYEDLLRDFQIKCNSDSQCNLEFHRRINNLEEKSKLNSEIDKPKTRKVRKENND
jgi:hypothetical protein